MSFDFPAQFSRQTKSLRHFFCDVSNFSNFSNVVSNWIDGPMVILAIKKGKISPRDCPVRIRSFYNFEGHTIWKICQGSKKSAVARRDFSPVEVRFQFFLARWRRFSTLFEIHNTLDRTPIYYSDKRPISTSMKATLALTGPKNEFNLNTNDCFSVWHQKTRLKSVKKHYFLRIF